MDIPKWKARLEVERKEKDRFFAQHWQSPLSPEDRRRFKGLAYFPLDSKYRFELEIHEHEAKQALTMEMSRGGERAFLRWGEFRFELAGKACALQAYKTETERDELFVLFRDATSGVETYAAGRYLDLHPEENLIPGKRWVLDFNNAYNPWCAYSEAYTCPLVPIENWLDVPVWAGEKIYSL